MLQAMSDSPSRPARRRAALPPRSAIAFRWFSRYVTGYLARHFHAVRLAGRPPVVAADRPLVIYLNHPSWWDPLVCVALAGALFGDRVHYAPIDSGALGQYGILRRLGFFGVEAGTPRGAASFLGTAHSILKIPGAILWLTPEGRFTDPRQRPVRIQPGLAHLARRLSHGTILPLALEHPFWDERTPEALALFGTPLEIEAKSALTVAQWQARLERELTDAQDQLARVAMRRDAEGLSTLIGGRAGVGGVYDLWRRFRSRLRGERFSPEHSR